MLFNKEGYDYRYAYEDYRYKSARNRLCGVGLPSLSVVKLGLNFIHLSLIFIIHFQYQINGFEMP